MKTNSATLVFFLFSNLGPGILPSKNGMKSPGPRLSLLLLPFIFLALRIFFPSPSLMWFSALSSDAKNCLFALFPSIDRQIFLSSFSKIQLDINYITVEIPQVTQAQNA